MITKKAPCLFVLTLLLSFICVAQQPAPEPAAAQAPAEQAATTNNIQLVIDGKVTNVHDGDTITVLDRNNKKFHIRLAGIDAPELKQEFGSVSQQNLSRLVLGKDVSIFWDKVDRYGRTVGTIKLDGRDINIEQVKAGMAWHFKKYADEQNPVDRVTYAAAEEQAHTAKLGLWAYENPMRPGDWRAGVKAKRWGPPPPEGTIIGNKGSMKYHRPDCVGYRDMAEKNRVFFATVADAEAAGYKRAGNCPPADQLAARPNSMSTAGSTRDTAPSMPPPAASGNATTDSTTDEAEDEVTAEDSGATQADAAKPSGNTAPNLVEGQHASAPVTNASSPQGSDAKVIGNKNSKAYHLPGCAGYTRVSEKNQVKFDSAAEAEKAGYHLAGNCHPSDSAKTETAPATPATTPTTDTAAAAPAPVAAEITPGDPTAAMTPAPTATPATTEPATAAPTTAPATNSGARIIGNKNSKIYHLPGCSGYTRVSEKNQVLFDTAADAEKAGYRIAKNCEAKP
ncbi:MAG TPA: thermonuclease family protein [Pyrinomonadaceae bacterium]|nr:thermonuclease family protein [Pyrinomonadaceae bacterium]